MQPHRSPRATGLVLAAFLLLLAMSLPATALHRPVGGEVTAIDVGEEIPYFAFDGDVTISAGSNVLFQNAIGEQRIPEGCGRGPQALVLLPVMTERHGDPALSDRNPNRLKWGAPAPGLDPSARGWFSHRMAAFRAANLGTG